jgi:hypothetical protein
MGKIGLVVLCLTVLASAGESDGTRVLAGHYTWNGGAEGDVEAEFAPTGDGTWDVSFRFTFSGQDHTYSGTAEGNLSEGDLVGTVSNESGKRTFTFDGTFKKGKFRGTHAEIERGKPQETGSLTLEG